MFGLPAEAAHYNNIAILEALGKKKVCYLLPMIVVVHSRAHFGPPGGLAQEAARSVVGEQHRGRHPHGRREAGPAEHNVSGAV